MLRIIHVLLYKQDNREKVWDLTKKNIAFFRNPEVLERKEVFYFFKRLTTLSAALCSAE